jgi:tetratricopeptide (TPR) repeat protein
MPGDPYLPHLERARDLYGKGEVLQAGQIWQAILKKQPDHAEARAGLLQVKRWMDARKAQAAPPPVPVPQPEPMPAPSEAPSPRATRVYQSTVPYKPFKPAEPAPLTDEPDPVPAAPEAVLPPPGSLGADELEPSERLLKEGCTLYDMGQAEEALLKWEQILAQEPTHALAQAYAAQARQELGYEPVETPAARPHAAAPPPSSAPTPPVELEELLRRASQLYEMGSLEQSIASLERILESNPTHGDAQRFLLLARRELAESTPPVHVPPAPPPVPTFLAPVPAPVPTPTVQSSPRSAAPVLEPPPQAKSQEPPSPARTSGGDTLEQKLGQGERLLLLGRFEEASFAFQMALTLAPRDSRAIEGLQRASAPPIPAAPPPAEATLSGVPAAAPASVHPPASLMTPAPTPRPGPELPRTLKDLGNHPILGSTRVLVGGAALVVVLGVGLQMFQKHRQDGQLRAAVAHARESAVSPVALTTQTLDLAESVSALRQEADAAMAIDPLRAYHRAKELLRRDPTDAVAAALMEKAKLSLVSDPVAGVSLTEFQRLLNAGDLEGAERAIDALLRAKPDDLDLLHRAARLERVLAGLHAYKGEWNEAKAALLKGRAFFPEDKTWQARIQLLQRLQTLPKAEQAGWLPFLG